MQVQSSTVSVARRRPVHPCLSRGGVRGPGRILQLAAIAGAMGLASAAHGQCEFFIPGVPDFDQRREGALPNDGRMYCVPTAIVNWFAYFANRGLPQPVTLDGPRYWQSNANYDRVSNTIALMGGLMGTDPDDGTTGGNGLWGAWFYALVATQGKVSIAHHWCGDGYCPTPDRLRTAHLLGGHVAFVWGRYNEDSALHFTRDGGHCVSMNGLDPCTFPQTISYRDPASAPMGTSQSTFVTHTADLLPVVAFYRGKNQSTYTFDLRYRIFVGSSSSFRFLDGWFVLYPLVALTVDPLQPLSIQLHRPVLFGSANNIPTHQSFETPAGTWGIRGVAIHPQQTDYYYATAPSPPGVPHEPATIYHLDPVTGASTSRMTKADIVDVLANRHGELYVVDGQTVSVYDMDPAQPLVIGSLANPETPEAIAVDDASDDVAILLPTTVPTRKILNIYSRDLSTLGPGSGLLPPTVTIDGKPSMALASSPSGRRCFISSPGVPAIHILLLLRAEIQHVETINLPPGSAPMALDVDGSGHIFYTSGGFIRELMPDPAGGWMPNPDSIFDGLRGGSHLILAKSRTNHIPEIHEGPEWVNLVEPDIAPGVPDCYANCDGSTTAPILNVDDFICFIDEFAAALMLPREQQIGSYANCDESTTVPVLNVDDFICFINRFGAGCP
jgi:hypothetical protein